MLPSCCFCKERTSSIIITGTFCNWCWLLCYSGTPPVMTTLDYFHWIEVHRGQASFLLVIDGLYIKYYWRLEGWGGRGTCWRYLWLIACPTLLIGNTFYYKETFLLKTNGGKNSILGLLFTASQQSKPVHCSGSDQRFRGENLSFLDFKSKELEDWTQETIIPSESLLVSSSHPPTP